jgi:hypothetical protein
MIKCYLYLKAAFKKRPGANKSKGCLGDAHD